MTIFYFENWNKYVIKLYKIFLPCMMMERTSEIWGITFFLIFPQKFHWISLELMCTFLFNQMVFPGFSIDERQDENRTLCNICVYPESTWWISSRLNGPFGRYEFFSVLIGNPCRTRVHPSYFVLSVYKDKTKFHGTFRYRVSKPFVFVR